MYKSQYVRINTRVTSENNQWLDDYGKANGLSKSALINMAIELFILQKNGQVDVVDQNVIKRFDRLEELVKQLTDQKPE